MVFEGNGCGVREQRSCRSRAIVMVLESDGNGVRE
jgi:hypothetical protein